MKELKNGQCYKHEVLNVYRKVINTDKDECIYVIFNETHKKISTGILHRIDEDDFILISEQEFEKAKNIVLNYFKDL